PAQLERALGEAPAGVESASFGMRPSEVRKKPPIVVVVSCHPAAERQPRRVVIGAAAESVQAEGAQSEGENERVARMRLEMREQRLQRLYGLTVDGKAKDVDMRALARGRPSPPLPCDGQRVLGFGNAAVDLQVPGETRMSERESRVVCDRLLEARVGAGTGGKQEVDAAAVCRGGLRRSRGEREAVAVEVHHIHSIGLQA